MIRKLRYGALVGIVAFLLECLGGTTLFFVPNPASTAWSQVNTTPVAGPTYAAGPSAISAGLYFAPAYAAGFQNTVIVLGNSATGSQSITLSSGDIKLPDGRRIVPYAVGVPLLISDASAEIVTITAVSGCNITGQVTDFYNSQGAGPTCVITASFANTHGAGAKINSGDQGYLEAVNDASNNGGGTVYWLFDTGPLTLSTSGATTTYTQPATGGAPSNFFPINAFIDGVNARVTTTITSCTGGWRVDDGTTSGRFIANSTTFTAGTTSVNSGTAWNTGIAAAATGFQMAANKSMVITCTTSNASAGAVRVRAWGHTPVVANF